MDSFSDDLQKTELSRQKTTSTILFIIALVVLAFIISLLFKLGPEPPEESTGWKAYDFPDEHIWLNSSEPLSIHDQLRKHVIVTFFCEFTSLAELHDLSKLTELDIAFGNYPVSIIVILENGELNINELNDMIDSWGIDFPIVVDHTGMISDAFSVSTFPALLVLDSRARISARFYEGWNSVDIGGIINDLINDGEATRSLAISRYKPIQGSFIPDSVFLSN